eukprot:scaffold10651_cov112-Isochrysis_galbana.AAC.9
MPPKGVWEGPHVILHFVNNDDVVPFPRALVPSLPCYLLFVLVKCARFRDEDEELNLESLFRQGRGIIMWGLIQTTCQ